MSKECQTEFRNSEEVYDIVQATRLIKEDFSFVNLCQLLPTTFLSFMYLQMLSRTVASISILETKVKLASL